jgi:DNA-binding winged helix-turn-helix (wHTH) protein/Tol biopolymer transport system component
VKTSASPSAVTRFGVFELDLQSRELRKQGMKIRLQGQPVQILVMLLERPGEVVTREELQKKLWASDTFVDFEQGLNNAMKRLRAALDDDAETPRFIETLPRRGYRFIGAVNNNGHTLAADAGTPALQVKPGRRSALSLLAASIVVVVLALWWVSRIEPPPPKITSVVQLTSDGRVKCYGSIATDGVRVYFSELFDDGCRVMAVSVSGGQPVPIRTPFPRTHVLNISRDMSELLVSEGDLNADRPLWVVPTLGGPPRRLGNVVAHDGSWSPNGQKFVYANGSALYLTNSDGTKPRLLVSASSNPVVRAEQLVWSLDGKRVRFTLFDESKQRVADANVGSLWEITTEGKDMHPLFPGWQDPPMQCCGSRTPDGRYYLFVSWKNLPGSGSFPAQDIWAVRERNGLLRGPSRPPVQLTVGPLHFSNLVSSLDGKVLFAISNSNRGELMRYDRKTQQLSPYPTGISAEGVNFSKDGAWMTYVTWPEGQLWRSRSDGSEALQLTFAPLRAFHPNWSPDGKQIAYSGINPGGDWQIYLVSRDGSTSQRLLADPTAGIDPTWSPDGGSILFGQPPTMHNTQVHNVLQIFNLKSGRTSVVPGSEGLRSPRFSPDGRYISATSATDDELMLFDVARQKWTAPGPSGGWQCWSKDSKFVYFLDAEGETGVFRVSVDSNKLERILSLKGFREAGTWGAWLSLTPEDDPLVLRDVGPPEIYALSWDAP